MGRDELCSLKARVRATLEKFLTKRISDGRKLCPVCVDVNCGRVVL